MLSLFKIEWLKIKTYRTFWILFVAFLVMYPLAFYFSGSKYLERNSSNKGEEMIKSFLGNPYMFPKVWQSAAWFGGMFFIMVGMLFILLITNEVQYRTHRQNIIDGWSRMDFLKAKLSLMIFFVLVATLLVCLAGFFVGLAFSSDISHMSEGLEYIGYFALMAFIYLAFAYLIAIFVKRTGLAIIIYFAGVCIDTLLWLVLTLRGNQAGYFLPLETVDSLITFPLKPAVMQLRTVGNTSLVIGALFYLGLFTFLVINYFRKVDLKT
ncbi:MAG: ABC transporter permease [Ferruginibacter sp.]